MLEESGGAGIGGHGSMNVSSCLSALGHEPMQKFRLVEAFSYLSRIS